MKKQIVAIMAVAALALGAQAATYYWDDGTVTANGASGGGTGAWTVGASGWEDGSIAQNWANGNAAVFGGTAGTVTLGGAISATTVTNAVDGYIITGNTLTISTAAGIYASGNTTINSGISLGTAQSWSVATGKTLTLGGAISGTSTLTYGGAGSYVLSGLNSNSGNLTIDAATVTVNTGATLFCQSLGWGFRSVTIQNNATLVGNTFQSNNGNFWGECGDGAGNMVFAGTGGTFKYQSNESINPGNKGITVNSGATGHFYVPTGYGATWTGSYSGRNFITNGTLDFNGGGNFTSAWYISGTGNVTKSDGGTLTLTAINSFSGSLAVSGGTLVASATTSSGSSSGTGSGASTNTITINSNATLKYTGGRGSGYHSANVNINGGTLTFDSSDNSLAVGKTVTFDTAAGAINGTGQWRFRGGATVSVTAAATGSAISVGTLDLYDGTETFNIASGATLNVSSKLTRDGGGTLAKSGSGTLILSSTAAGSSVGNITISTGTLDISGQIGSGTTGSYSGTINNSGTLIYSNNSALTQTLSGVISNTGALTKSGSSTLVLSGANTYSGTTSINGGVLQANVAQNGTTSGPMGANGTISFGGGTLQHTTSNTTDYSARFSTAGGQQYKVDTNGQSVIWATALTSSGGTLAKSGSGTLTLSNANTYAGATTINAGTLNVTGSLASGSAVALNGGKLMGTGTVGGTVTVATGVSAVIGDTASTGTLTIGNLTFNGTGIVNAGVLSATTPTLNVTGTLTLSGGAGAVTLNLPTAGVGAGTYHLIGTTLNSTSGFTLGSIPSLGSRQNGSLASTASYIDYVVSGVNPYWTGAFDGNWDTSTLNWYATSATAYINAPAADAVLFDDNATGTTTVSMASNLSPSAVTFNNSSKAYTLTGAAGITGSAALIKSGAGALTINNANAYNGGTTLNGGTLTLGDGGALGSGSITLNGGTLDINGKTITNGVVLADGELAGNGGTISGALSETGSRALTVGSSLTLTGAITYTGATTITAGTLEIGGASQINSGSYAGNISDAGTLKVNTTADQGLSGDITGAGNLVKASTGTLTLSGANTYSGKTSITGGTLSISADSRLGTAPGSAVADQLTIDGGTLRITVAEQTLAAKRGITLGSSGGTIDTSSIGGSAITTTIGGDITGTGALTLKSTGNLSASGGGDGGLGIKLNSSANSFIGDVTITSGLVSYAADGSFGNAANKIVLNGGGLLDPNGTGISLSRNIQVLSGGGTFRTYGSTTVAWSGALTGTGGINRTDGGTLTLSGDLSGYTGTYNNQGGTTTMSNKIVGGNLTISGGSVNLNGTGTAGNVSVSGGALNVGASANVTVGAISNASTSGSLSIAAGGILNASSYTASYAPSTYSINGTLNLSGALTSSWAATKSITGTGTINANAYANNNYSITTFDALRLNIGSGGITQSQAGSVTFNGTTIGASANWSSSVPFTLNTGTTTTFNTLDSVNNSTGRIITLSGALSGSGALTKAGAGTLTLSSTNSFTGALTINGGTLEATAATSGNGSAIGGGSNTINVNSGGTLLFSTNDRTAGYHSGAVNIRGGTVAFNTSDNSFAAGNTVTFDTAAGTINGSGQWRFRGGATVHVTAAASGSAISVGSVDMYDGMETFNIDTGALLTVSSMLTNDGGGSLAKTGGGTLTLTGANTYTGATAVNNGTLQIGVGGSLASGSAVSVATGASLINNGAIGGTVTTTGTGTVSGTGTFGGLATINGTLNPGNSPGYQAYAGGLDLTSASTTTFELSGTSRATLLNNGNGYYDALDITGGTFTLDGAVNVGWLNGFEATLGDSFQLLDWTGTGSQNFTGFDVGTDLTLPGFTDAGLAWDKSAFLTNGTITVIPEPATVGMIGLVGAMALLRRRMKINK